MSFFVTDDAQPVWKLLPSEIVVLNFCDMVRALPQGNAAIGRFASPFADSPCGWWLCRSIAAKLTAPPSFWLSPALPSTHAHDGSYKSARNAGLIGLPTTLVIDERTRNRKIGR